ncbi:hypothetical protein BU25DRAFT_412435 [Macroventuria anomochaeta]|uniref:Uncharacterized protein n=1 Tax=Macroventuria anomochaeta TaxID=301207 RepID=A0ACB6RV75_9PLEO|nr:uncharacterized protein BU25DRAFT_412435 [Macroventuria anomochaeta]KAF2625786.1 hypothetical protein BU25DRAFT_412435 [Macroventuria anomochaeta]
MCRVRLILEGAIARYLLSLVLCMPLVRQMLRFTADCTPLSASEFNADRSLSERPLSHRYQHLTNQAAHTCFQLVRYAGVCRGLDALQDRRGP